MIVMASNVVGLQVIEYLATVSQPISILVLDPSDPQGCNDRITRSYERSNPTGRVMDAEQLANEDVLDALGERQMDLGLLAWWPRIVKGRLLTLPRRGWINLHPSLLPFNRGKHPNFWCLVDETPCGVTLHWIDSGVDTGDIIVQREIPTSWEDTGESIYRKSTQAIVELFKEYFIPIKEGKHGAQVKQPAAGTFHWASEIDRASEIKLDETVTARKLLNVLRARNYPPHPSAFFYEGDEKFAVEVRIRRLPG